MQDKAKNWTSKQLKAIDMLANIDEPKTKTQIAKEVNIDLATLWRWQHLEGFNEAVYERAMFYFNASLPEALTSVKRAGKKGNVDALKLWLQHCGKLKEKVESEVKVVICWDEEEHPTSDD